MNKYKILVSDFDGTLANSNNEISKENLDAINSFIGRGGVFVVCTGRATDSIKKLLDKVGYKGLLASFNGAVITDMATGKEVYRNGLSKELAIRFFEYAVKNDIYAHYYFGNGYYYFKHTSYTDEYEKVTWVKGTHKPDIISAIKSASVASPKLLIFDDKEKLDLHHAPLIDLLPECDVVRSNDNMIDINLIGVNKGTACEILAGIYGAKISDVIAVGDAGNDVAMLELAVLSFCMANGEQSAKDVAKKIAPSNDDNGIKYIIEKE